MSYRSDIKLSNAKLQIKVECDYDYRSYLIIYLKLQGFRKREISLE